MPLRSLCGLHNYSLVLTILGTSSLRPKHQQGWLLLASVLG